MTLSTMLHGGLLAGATALSLAAPAGAATVLWQAGPLALDAGKVAQVAVTNPDIFPCRVGVQIFATPAGRVTTGTSTASMTALVNTVGNPNLLPAGGLVTVGVQDPNEKSGQRRLVTARVQTSCDGIAAATIRAGLGVTLQIGHPDIAETTAVLAAQPR